MALPFDPVAFSDRYLKRNEKGEPWALNRHQRRVLARMFRRHFPLRLWSEVKKSGKTFLAAVLGLAWAYSHAKTEVIVAANDLEQSVSRVFKTMVALLEENPELGASATVRAQEIKLSNGTIITAIASEYRSAAGSRHSLVIFDELWGFDSERAQRLYEELTPPPSEPEAWVLVVSTAGYTGESTLLETMYTRGLAGERVDDELEVYEADGLCMLWSHVPRMPWQTSEYYAEQARSLRPNTFARLHRNEWVSAESTFLPAELWDGATDPEHSPMLPNKTRAVWLGVDAAIVGDYAAVFGVTRAEEGGDWLEAAFHQVWRPSKEHPLDLEDTIEGCLREVQYRYRVAGILVDPYQMHRSIMTLQRAGLPIEPFPQTPANLTRMASALYELIKGGNLRLYPDAELRWMAMNTRAIETSRGLRIGKETASKKIDGIVALSMACVGCLDDARVLTNAPLCW